MDLNLNNLNGAIYHPHMSAFLFNWIGMPETAPTGSAYPSTVGGYPDTPLPPVWKISEPKAVLYFDGAPNDNTQQDLLGKRFK